MEKTNITQEELDRLAEWLKSDEGRKAIRESQETANEVNKIIDKMRDIDPEKLREPYMTNAEQQHFDNNIYNFIQKGI